MRFSLLGPLRVHDDGEPVPLGGTNQRAALAYLLLYPNRVVATSQLIEALWGGDAPPSARKILQNAISNLRRILGQDQPDDSSVLLLTRAPGYALLVDPESVDVCRFMDLAKKGRAALGESRFDDADRELRAALALWNGPALADLAEHGYNWPELTALQNAKFVALEDLMETALATGQYLEVITELEPLVGRTPLRDRLCRQLMLALYHSGRQADALTVYRRTRSVLVGRLGLDPSPELRELERAILDHDPGLTRAGAAPVRPIAPVRLRADAEWRDDGFQDIVPVKARAEEGGPPAPEPAFTVAGGERRRVTALLVRADVDEAVAPETLEYVLAGVGAAVSARVGRRGGSGHQTMGPVLLVLFGTDRTREDDARRAVEAAMDVARLSPGGLRLRVAVAAGDALVVHDQHRPGGRHVTGHLVGTGLDLLAAARPGVVRACEQTRELCRDRFEFTSVAGEYGFDLAERAQPELSCPTDLPFVDRAREMQQLLWWLDDVRHNRRPHRVTILGPAGIGKSRLMHEFQRRVADGAGVRCLVGCDHSFGPDTPYAALARVVRSYAGIAAEDSPAERDRKLADAMTGLVGAGEAAARLTDNLRDLVARPSDRPVDAAPVDHRAALLAWRWFVEELAALAPVVIILENLHVVDDVLLRFVGDLVEGVVDLPLLLVVTARTELFDRQEYWAGGNRSATTMSLDPLPRAAVERLLDGLLPRGTCTTDLVAGVLDQAGGNPLYAVEYARMLAADTSLVAERDARRLPVPPVVHTIISARLDTLAAGERVALYDAALLGTQFGRGMLAALDDRTEHELDLSLESLVRHELLRRSKFGPEQADVEYAFTHRLVGEVAVSRLPHHVRAEKHLRTARWLSARGADSPALLVHHCRQAVVHTARAGRPQAEVAGEISDILFEAGQRALSSGAIPVAQACYRAAVDFCPDGHPRRAELFRWRELKAASGS
ncbi:BTAD domain-containing putative transcriptional regulator [Actinophytocola sp.]|uniref:BTAD domain-containing putative transcriptional regulator n=1 Tax=Actinophytocola sp. TaxID=1872138 RepID=UPI002D4FDE50|nr:BTAD domain-containing putative transcriptional regulator [Actinophytocola sp.]HYQ68094.1 BTAD domain-containing putative transcriptional regulator [Actinophytocola sp.]